ncbi:hypothetical protein, partial [Blautia sp.]|uniref:hypothetical protein n=1 Tax=Blautia sp. TaxID=1955243 RepID=UPI002E7863A5
SSNKLSPKILGIIISHISFPMTYKFILALWEIQSVDFGTLRLGTFLLPLGISSLVLSVI